MPTANIVSLFLPPEFDAFQLLSMPDTFFPMSADDFGIGSDLDSPLCLLIRRNAVWAARSHSAEPEQTSRKSNLLKRKRTVKKKVSFRNLCEFIVHMIPNKYDDWLASMERSPIPEDLQVLALSDSVDSAVLGVTLEAQERSGKVTLGNRSYHLPGSFETITSLQCIESLWPGTSPSRNAYDSIQVLETSSGEKIRVIPPPSGRKWRDFCIAGPMNHVAEGRFTESDVVLVENYGVNRETSPQSDAQDIEPSSAGEESFEEQLVHSVPHETPKVSIWFRISHLAQPKQLTLQIKAYVVPGPSGRKIHSYSSIVAIMRRMRHRQLVE